MISRALDEPRIDLDDGGGSRILMRWLIGLRWAVFGFLAAALPLGERFLGFHVEYVIAVPVIVLIASFNAVMHRRVATGREPSSGEIAVGVALDLVAIGAVLAASGGAANPLSAVFFVHVALAASLLPARTTFALAALAACVFGALFTLPAGACCPNHPANGAFSTHLYGMWIAFVVASGMVAYFLTRVRGALDDRNREIARLRRQAEESARFASLGTLAAGMAHELCTPLGTIAVLAGEIDGATGAEAVLHAAAISKQVARCRDLLTRLQAGAASPRAAARAPIGAAVAHAVEAWRRAHPETQVTLAERVPPETTVPLSAEEIEVTLSALLDNALHAVRAARGEPAPILVEIASEGGALLVRVEDTGAGVAPELRARLGEPFLTTKEPGEGMGLGLYLVRRLLAEAGGQLEIAQREPQGTRITLRLAGAPV